MPQQLQVFKDPSIVNNVPTTPAEQLQLATEAKAAQMAAAQAAGSPAAQAINQAVPQPAGSVVPDKLGYQLPPSQMPPSLYGTPAPPAPPAPGQLALPWGAASAFQHQYLNQPSPWSNGGVFGGRPGVRPATHAAPGGGGMQAPSVPAPPQTVRIATGKVVPIGTTADGFTVHSNGSITDKYGNVTATANGPVGVAAVANSNSYKDASVPTPGGKFGE